MSRTSALTAEMQKHTGKKKHIIFKGDITTETMEAETMKHFQRAERKSLCT